MNNIFGGDALLFVKVVVSIILGVLIGISGKLLLKRYFKRWFLKNLFRHEPSVYRPLSLINKIIAESFQWIIIIVFINYGLLMLNINFLDRLLEYVGANAYEVLLFITINVFGFIIAKLVGSRVKEKDIENNEQIGLIIELILLFAFILTSLEVVGIKATPLMDLYRITLYVIGAIVVAIVIISYLNSKSPIKKKRR